jgi:hypothetical protein
LHPPVSHIAVDLVAANRSGTHCALSHRDAGNGNPVLVTATAAHGSMPEIEGFVGMKGRRVSWWRKDDLAGCRN